jgi:hypothetical protein
MFALSGERFGPAGMLPNNRMVVMSASLIRRVLGCFLLR